MRRYPARPRAAKPSSIIAQVEGSGVPFGGGLIETHIVDEEIPKSSLGSAGNGHDRAGGRQAEKLKTTIQVRRNHKAGGITNVISDRVGFVGRLAVQDVQEEVGHQHAEGDRERIAIGGRRYRSVNAGLICRQVRRVRSALIVLENSAEKSS